MIYFSQLKRIFNSLNSNEVFLRKFRITIIWTYQFLLSELFYVFDLFVMLLLFSLRFYLINISNLFLTRFDRFHILENLLTCWQTNPFHNWHKMLHKVTFSLKWKRIQTLFWWSRWPILQLQVIEIKIRLCAFTLCYLFACHKCQYTLQFVPSIHVYLVCPGRHKII